MYKVFLSLSDDSVSYSTVEGNYCIPHLLLAHVSFAYYCAVLCITNRRSFSSHNNHINLK